MRGRSEKMSASVKLESLSGGLRDEHSNIPGGRLRFEVDPRTEMTGTAAIFDSPAPVGAEKYPAARIIAARNTAMPRKLANRAPLSPDINLPSVPQKNTAGFDARRLFFLSGGEDSKKKR